MLTNHWVAALAVATLSFSAACAVNAGDSKQATPDTSSTASADTVFEATPATRAAIGIAYYAFDSAGNGKAFGPDGAVIATFDVTRDAEKSALRVGAYGRHVDVVYSVHKAADSFGVDGTVDGAPFSANIAKGGAPVIGAPGHIDAAFGAIFLAVDRDSAAHAEAHMSARCHGLLDSAGLAFNAGDNFAGAMLEFEFQWNGCNPDT